MYPAGCSHAAATASASSAAPAPPSDTAVHTATSAPVARAIRRIASCSEGWSPGNALIATTGEIPKDRAIARWWSRFAAPASTSPGFSWSISAGSALPGRTL